GDYEFSELTVARISSDTSLLQAVQEDSEIVELRTLLLNGGDGLEGYGIVDGDMQYKGRLVLPRTSSLIPLIFREMHGMRRDVIKLVSERSTCQRNKYSNLAPAGLLQPLNLPEHIWEELSMDFIDGLPKSEGYKVIMGVVDRLGKSAHFIPLKHPYTAASVAVKFIRGIVRLHGIPKSIVSDRDRIDGQTEVVNRSLETYLRCFSSSKPKQWVKWLPWAEYWYNTSFHSSIGMTPFKAVIGDHVAEPELPVGLTEDMVVVCKPVEVIGTREGSEGLEVLVMWEGLTHDEATWERADLLSKQFPALHLEDKVNFQGGVMIRTGADSEKCIDATKKRRRNSRGLDVI
ncbi:putative mitochondrial protein, partial [Tanacetum coccineum]